MNKRIILGALSILPAVVSLVAINLEFYPVVSYAVGKGLMLLVPVVAWMMGRRGRREIMLQAGLVRTNGMWGVGLGVVMAAVILAGYYVIFRNYIDAGQVVAKVKSLGIYEYYWFAAVYFSLGNAFLEEYYFRSFLVSEYMQVTGDARIVAGANGLVFGLHHFVMLITMLPVSLALGLSVGTAMAGVVWAYVRIRGVSIIDCYISHIIADLAIFYAGWQLILASGQ